MLIILADDLGVGELGLHGNTHLETPSLDALGRASVRFGNFHVHSVCSPTRAGLLTGRHPHRMNVWGVHQGREYMNLDEITFADVLSKTGYATGMVGKWHNGKNGPWLPWRRGFQHAYWGTGYKNDQYTLEYNDEGPVNACDWSQDTITDYAIGFLREHRNEPFCLYVAYNAPHSPWCCPQRFLDKYLAKGLGQELAHCFGEINHLDEAIGRLLEGLDSLDLSGNTVVLFMSDNGADVKTLTASEFALRNPQGYRGAKGSPWDGGSRSPLLVRWPGRFQPAEVDRLACIEDIYPTLLELAGAVPPDNQKPLDGKSLLPLLGDDRDLAAWPDRVICDAHYDPNWPGKTEEYSFLADRGAIRYDDQTVIARNQRFKLLHCGPRHARHRTSKDEPHVIYDVERDPRETTDVAALHPEVTRRLARAARDFYEPLTRDPRTFCKPTLRIGYEGEQASVLWACCAHQRFGQVSGSLSTGGFTAVNAGLAMPVRIAIAGRYLVRMHAVGVAPGAVLMLRVGDSQIEYSAGGRDWVSLGEVNLPSGQAELELRVKQMPVQGPAIDRLFYLEFRRQ
jgi:arylsulfatase A-like enzyme